MFFLYILLLGLNFIISWSNASYVGRYWSESKEVGGSFRRHVVCGYIMAQKSGIVNGVKASLFQETVDNLGFGLVLSEAEAHELIELVTGDFADGSLMNKLGIDVLGV